MRWSQYFGGSVLVVTIFTMSTMGILAATNPTDTSPPWLVQLDQLLPDDAALTAAIRPLVQGSAVANHPDLAVITYHIHNDRVQDVVVQVFQGGMPANAAPLINPHGVVHERIGDGLGDASGKFLGLVLQPARYFGDAAEIARQQRALQLSVNGDLSLLREQTIDPLQVVAILPQARRYLPSSLGGHVQAVLLTAQLTFGEWRGKLSLLADDADAADQIGNVVAGWRDLAGSLANVFAGYSSGQPLRDSLRDANVVVADNRITAVGVIPAATVVRVAKELAGHGGGCPPGGPCDHDKVAICHNGQTMCVESIAVAGHLAQGDYCGPCLAGELTKE